MRTWANQESPWQRTYANQTEAKVDIISYIVGLYNCKRINLVLGNLSPAGFERKMAARKPIGLSEIT